MAMGDETTITLTVSHKVELAPSAIIGALRKLDEAEAMRALLEAARVVADLDGYALKRVWGQLEDVEDETRALLCKLGKAFEDG